MTPAYRVETAPTAQRRLRRLPRELQVRLGATIDSLATDPRPHGYRPVVTRPGSFRVRVGDWRLIYSIDDEQRLVTILEIMPRGEDYRLP